MHSACRKLRRMARFDGYCIRMRNHKTFDESAQFQALGYYVLANGMTAQQRAALCSACDAIMQEQTGVVAAARFHKIDVGTRRQFLRHRHKDFPAVADFVLGAQVARIVKSVLGPTAYLFNEQFVVKGAGTGASFAWHQDSGYVGFDHAPYVTLWCALDDATLENGCLHVLARSLDDAAGVLPHRWDEAGSEMVGYEGEQAGTALPCKAGTIVVLSSLTLHRSGPNSTGRVRRAYVCQYSAEPILHPDTRLPLHFATPLRAA
jgi:ectoine hydroxylase-related dioxygenase (phytanoyl-CoA dioxygenase family)